VTRLFVLVVLAVVLTAGMAALAVLLGLSSLPVVPGVLLVAYAAIVHPPTEAAVGAALIGLAMDALAGTPLGVNVLASVAVLVGSRVFAGWVTAPRGLPSFLFVACVSVAHAFLSLLLLFLFQRREAFGFVGLFSTALANALASVVLFPIIQRIFVGLALEERGESLQERLASKS
jgi:cell shape-determining protein MreD